MANQKLTDRGSLSTSNDADLIHVVQENKSYNQSKSNFLKEDRVVLGTHTSQITTHTSQIAGLTTNNVGVLAIADTPTQDGIYIASESGTYINAGGLIVDLQSTITYISVSGSQTVFDLIEIPIESIGTFSVTSLSVFDALIAGATKGTWVVVNDFTLDSSKVIPEGVTLEFRGGIIDLAAYDLAGTNTAINVNSIKIIDYTGIGRLIGTWSVDKIFPEWFGAIADGVADDLTYIQSALYFSKISEGSVVLKKDKTYLVSGLLVIPSNTTFTSDVGTSTIKALRADLTTDMFNMCVNEEYFLNPISTSVDDENIIISNLIFDVNASGLTGTPTINNKGAGIKLYNVDNALISNVVIHNTHTVGIVCSGLFNSIIENVYLYDIGLKSYATGVDDIILADGNGLSLYQGNHAIGNNIVRNCRAENFRDNGFTMYAQNDNTFKDCYSNSISSVTTTNSQGGFSVENTADNCIIRDCTSVNTPYGVILSNDGYRARVIACDFTSDIAGVLISKSIADIINCDISLTGLAGVGIIVGTDDLSSYYDTGSKLINNRIDCIDYTIDTKGILLRNPKNVIIKNNEIINAQKFIEAKRGSGIPFASLTESNLIIDNNILLGNCQVVIQINELKGVYITNNIFDGISSAYGIYMNEQTELINIVGNRISQNSSVGIQSIYFEKASSNSLVKNNPTIGWFDASRWFKLSDGTYNSAQLIQSGDGTPENVYYASIGSIWYRTDGGTSTTLYVKESDGTLKTGWVAK
jgi:hypothetical protein